MDKYNSRTWLNITKGSAFIEATDDQLSIADCTRIVNLDFYIESNSSKIELDNVEYKIDVLYEEIRAYRKYIKKEIRRERKNIGKV